MTDVKSPEEVYEAREKRVSDAIQLRVPDRVPVMCAFSFFPARYAGITYEEAMYDYDKMMQAWTDTTVEFAPDMYDNPYSIRHLGPVLETLDFKQLKWPGHGVGPMTSYQFVEEEYMRADEYDAFLYDPADFMVRTYWPRISESLRPLKKLPPLYSIITYYMGFTQLRAFDTPEIADALDALIEAAKQMRKVVSGTAQYAQKMKKLGFPPQFGALTQAPFDTLSDFFRGTRGAMLDIYRNPDKLLAATEKLYPIMLEYGLSAKRRGIPRVFIPLHKGLDGFMSGDQFERFYWPTLKKLIWALTDEGLNPVVLWEGDCTSRLETIGDVPKGKVVYWMEKTDIFRAKEILGGTVCLRGNVPLPLLCTGTPVDVKGYCRKLIDVVGKDGGFIMDSATVVDDAKPENVRVMIDYTKEYGIYR